MLRQTFIIFSLGYYESESDDIDVPLSKRINRLNIENPTIVHRSPLNASQFSANNSNSPNIPSEGTNHNQNSWQLNGPMGDFSDNTRNLSHEPVASNGTRDHSINLQLSSSASTFSERYNYPENSQYYQSNQLLYDLYRERQMRQNHSTL